MTRQTKEITLNMGDLRDVQACVFYLVSGARVVIEQVMVSWPVKGGSTYIEDVLPRMKFDRLVDLEARLMDLNGIRDAYIDDYDFEGPDGAA